MKSMNNLEYSWCRNVIQKPFYNFSLNILPIFVVFNFVRIIKDIDDMFMGVVIMNKPSDFLPVTPTVRGTHVTAPVCNKVWRGLIPRDHISLILTLLVANLVNTKWCKKTEKWSKPCHMGTHLTVLIESHPMNTCMTGFRWFSKVLCPCALD